MATETLTPLLTADERRQAAADARAALAEDIGGGDLSAALLPADAAATARLLCRADTVLCGIAWFEACFRALAAAAAFDWRAADGDEARAGDEICAISAPAAAMLSAERTALNFLQTLSATAACARRWRRLAGDTAAVLDTRKTLPLLRRAQKYAVRVGGGQNHRLGLFDEILIKENHIAAAGGVEAVLQKAFAVAGRRHVQIEVRDGDELRRAVAAGAMRVLLDNFSVDALRQAVAETPAEVELEASGGISEETLPAIAATGVARISAGALTKNIAAADFSLLLR